jgi:CheY-like chemotaxis protein
VWFYPWAMPQTPSLPQASGDDLPLATEAGVQSLPDQFQVLLVEDEPDIRKVIAWLLEEDGFKVEQAADGSEAAEGLKSGKYNMPDVILLDLLMPVMSGEEFLAWKRLSSDATIRKIPVIVTTGVAEVPPEVMRQARIVLRKPIAAEALSRAIRTATERKAQ